MTDRQDDGWVVVVPPARLIVADALWREWSASSSQTIDPEDVRVDLIRAVGGDHRRYLVRGIAPLLSLLELSELLVSTCAGARELLDRHIAEYDGEILGHLLVADVRRHLENEFRAMPAREPCGCLGVLAQGLDEGDASVQNAVAVSFVEDSRWWEPGAQGFMHTWPQPLRDEVQRQRDSQNHR